MLCTKLMTRVMLIISLSIAGIQSSYAAEELMLKSRLHRAEQTPQQQKSSLLTILFDSSAVYEYLLDSYDFVKLQDMTMRLWDRHTNARKYRYTMKDDFLDKESQ
ncbi:MAG: hypothetical protein R3F02_11325 [Thiolinea sp.]